MNKKVRIALVGIGNCASALIQGIEFYNQPRSSLIGVAKELGGYALSDLEFVLGFDVNKNKVGKTLDEAIFIAPNCAEFLFKPSRKIGPVLKGRVLDGLDSAIVEHVPVDENQNSVDVGIALKENATDILCHPSSDGFSKGGRILCRSGNQCWLCSC
jgi:myo-inositol-1-phosphate synthase